MCVIYLLTAAYVPPPTPNATPHPTPTHSRISMDSIAQEFYSIHRLSGPFLLAFVAFVS